MMNPFLVLLLLGGGAMPCGVRPGWDQSCIEVTAVSFRVLGRNQPATVVSIVPQPDGIRAFPGGDDKAPQIRMSSRLRVSLRTVRASMRFNARLPAQRASAMSER